MTKPSVTTPLSTTALAVSVRPENFRVRLVDAPMLAPEVRLLRFKIIDDCPFRYQAGQWIELFVPTGDGEIKRPYSMASAPRSQDHSHDVDFEIAVTRVGDGVGSCALHALALGTELKMAGPLGFFTREQRPSGPAFFIGTGTGITPLRAMIEEELRGPFTEPVVLVFGCRNEADLLWREEFEHLAKHHHRFRYEATLSRPDNHWRGRKGYVQHHLTELAAETPGAKEGHYYICGLNKMVQEVRNVLKGQLGLVRQQIHTERFD